MRFTLITPTYNRADCIGECIRSVADQVPGFVDFEHIIIDDGSNDGTPELLKAYEVEYNFIKTICYQGNAGVNYARNRGIESAKGQYIIFLDSDDTLNTGILKTIDHVISQNSTYKHFLFKVSSNDLQGGVKSEITFQDILLERIHGDYLHVVQSAYLKRNKFFEEFRAFENLNWLRIIRETQPLLALPLQAVSVQMRESDSLSKRIYKSCNEKILSDGFDARRLYLKLYGVELKSNSLAVFYKKVFLLFITGLRANLYAANVAIIKEHTQFKPLQGIFLACFNNRFFAFLTKRVYAIKYSIE